MKRKFVIAFTREPVNMIETGKCIVEIDEEHVMNPKEIERKLALGDLSSFLIHKRVAEDYEWEWEVVEEV